MRWKIVIIMIWVLVPFDNFIPLTFRQRSVCIVTMALFMQEKILSALMKNFWFIYIQTRLIIIDLSSIFEWVEAPIQWKFPICHRKFYKFLESLCILHGCCWWLESHIIGNGFCWFSLAFAFERHKLWSPKFVDFMAV